MKSLCKDCKNVGACKYAFGKYWADKSHGGIGCSHQFVPSDINHEMKRLPEEIRQGELAI